jgi:L-asparaginase II
LRVATNRNRRAAPPIEIEIRRGALVESSHRVAGVVVDADGAIVHAFGDPERAVYPRSAVKPLQALAVVESGAADAVALTAAELALATGSHAGEAVHVETARRWLGRLGLDPAALVCGAHPPFSAAAAHALVRGGEAPSALHNNCSGNHLAILTTARHLGQPLAGYEHPDHPVQLYLRRILAEVGDCDLGAAPTAIDGCSIPTIAIPLATLALLLARLGAPDRLPRERATAARRVGAAMAAHPEMVAGPGRFATEAMAATGGAVLIKSGAEGVMTAAWPARGLGVALKVEDGAERARDTALAAVLDRIGAFDAAARTALDRYLGPVLRNWRGVETGTIVARFAPSSSGDSRG